MPSPRTGLSLLRWTSFRLSRDLCGRRLSGRAFSLIELIAVMAILAIITGLVVPAVSGFGKSAALTSAGNSVVNLAGLARQTAITKNTMTALVLLADQGTPEDFRSLTVLEYSPVEGWTQIIEWRPLPTGAVVDSDASFSSFLTNHPKPFPLLNHPDRPRQSNPPLSYHGAAILDDAGYRARIFLPSGALANPDEAAQIRLVEGHRQGGRTIYTRRSGTAASNYYDVAFVGATGLTKVSRP